MFEFAQFSIPFIHKFILRFLKKANISIKSTRKLKNFERWDMMGRGGAMQFQILNAISMILLIISMNRFSSFLGMAGIT